MSRLILLQKLLNLVEELLSENYWDSYCEQYPDAPQCKIYDV